MKRNLSVGDALAILFLLVFVLVWVGAGSWVVANWFNDGRPVSDFASFFFLALIALPSIWAGSCVSHIVSPDDESRARDRQEAAYRER